MAKRSVKELYQLTQESEDAFVFYRLPGEERIHFIEGEASLGSEDWADNKAFVIQPFKTTETSPPLKIIAKNTQVFFLNDFEKKEIKEVDRTEDLLKDKLSRDTHIKILKTAITALKAGELDKVVLARIIKVKKADNFNSLDYFIRLCRWYPNTFCYFFRNSLGGSWIGASPELLFSQKDGFVETTSLAGTIRKDSGQIWRGKETTEQEIVSKYIEELFKKFGLTDYQKSELAELSMGRIAHLHNSYKAKTQLNGKLMSDFVKALQPTPAVSGFPKQSAVNYILKQEKDDRKYYSGFIGEVNPLGSTQLYVNLRCMEITENELLIHVGGGITADSNAEEEWRETCEKANTLLSLS